MNESILLAEVSNLSISLEDRTDDTKIKVELNNWDRLSLARARVIISNPTSDESKRGAKRKDKEVECIKRVKGKGKESAASKPKVASVAQLCGSRILHIIRSKNDSSKIRGHILLKDTEVLDNPNEVSLVPTEHVGYIKVELEPIIDLTNNSFKEDPNTADNLVTSSNTTPSYTDEKLEGGIDAAVRRTVIDSFMATSKCITLSEDEGKEASYLKSV